MEVRIRVFVGRRINREKRRKSKEEGIPQQRHG